VGNQIKEMRHCIECDVEFGRDKDICPKCRTDDWIEDIRKCVDCDWELDEDEKVCSICFDEEEDGEEDEEDCDDEFVFQPFEGNVFNQQQFDDVEELDYLLDEYYD